MRALFGNRKAERELDEELEAWLRLAEDELLRQGLSPREARRTARLRLGGKEQVKERVRRRWGGRWVADLLSDGALGLRALRREPAFGGVVLLTLALGIGANAAISGVVYEVLGRPLPYDDPGRLAMVWFSYDGSRQSRNPASGPELIDLRERSTRFVELAAIWSSTAALTGEGEPEQLRVGYVSANFFRTLGVGPALGRDFVAEDEGLGVAGGVQAVILSHGAFQRRFGGDRSLVGREILLDGWPATVVGVLPPGFELHLPVDSGVPRGIQAWLVFPWNVQEMSRGTAFLRVVGRLAPDATLAQAGDELQRIADELRSEHARYQSTQLRLLPARLQEEAVRHVRAPLLAVLGGSVTLLLVVCINVAHLQLGKLRSRRPELDLRLSLGAGRGRVARQLFAESLAVATLAAVLGLVLGLGVLRALPTLLPDVLASLPLAATRWAPVLVAVAASTVLVALASALPAVLAAPRRPRSLRGAARRPGRGLDRGLVVAQFAASFVLLVGAGLLLQAVVRMVGTDPGFRPETTLAFQLSLPRSRYPDDGARARVAQRVEDALAGLPGVIAAGASSHLPFDDVPNWYGFVWLDGADDRQRNSLMADHRAVTGGYLEALGAQLVAGRLLHPSDRREGRPVAVIDEMLATELWPGEPVMGRSLNLQGWDEGAFVERRVQVVGVVRHVYSHRLAERVRGQVYLPHSQNGRPILGWLVRAERHRADLEAAVAEAVHGIDPELPLARLRPFSSTLRAASSTARLTSTLANGFSLGALALAALGLYGVAARTVHERRGELGIRLALGATARQIRTAVMRPGLALVGAGIALGVPLALGTRRLLDGVLHGVESLGGVDLPTYGTVIAILALSALVAIWLPARRATRVDPMRCLRAE